MFKFLKKLKNKKFGFVGVEYCVIGAVIILGSLAILNLTTANTNEEALALLTEFGLPFRK